MPKFAALWKGALAVCLGAAVLTPIPAHAAAVEDLGVPLQDVLLIGGTVAPGPDGKTVLWGASSGAPAHLNAVDPVTGAETARYDLPGAGGSWAVEATPTAASTPAPTAAAACSGGPRPAG